MRQLKAKTNQNKATRKQHSEGTNKFYCNNDQTQMDAMKTPHTEKRYEREQKTNVKTPG